MIEIRPITEKPFAAVYEARVRYYRVFWIRYVPSLFGVQNLGASCLLSGRTELCFLLRNNVLQTLVLDLGNLYFQLELDSSRS